MIGRKEHEPSREPPHAERRRFVAVLAAAGGSALVYGLGYDRFGPGLASFSVVPVALVAWWYGSGPGAVAAVAAYPLLTMVSAVASEWDEGARNGLFGGPGTVAVLLVALIVGAAGRRLREAEARARALERESLERASAMAASDDWMLTIDRDLCLGAFNRAFGDAVGRAGGPAVAEGVVMIDLLPAATRAWWVAQLRRALDGEAFEVDHTVRIDERERVVNLRFEPRFPAAATPSPGFAQEAPVRRPASGVSVVGRDVTTLRVMQAHLRHAARTSHLASFVAAVAHEINNRLASLRGNLDFVSDSFPEREPDVADALGDAIAAVERVTGTVRDLQAYIARDEASQEPTDVNRAMEKAMAAAWSQVKHRARVERTFGDLRPVLANAAGLVQVFGNLLANAAEAIPEGEADRNFVRLRTFMDGDSVVAEVSDSGCGIPAPLLPQVFEPFFTTKPIGSGPGLGLHVARDLVASFGGTIEAESRPGEGTTMRVRLPAVAPRREAAPGAVPAEAVPRARILVIDDHADLRLAVQRLLHRHEVVLVDNAQEGLARLQRKGDYDLVLCDLMMPKMTGMDFFEGVATVRPGLEHRIAFMTGGVFTERARQFLARVENPRFAKPFTAEVVEAALRRVESEDQGASARGLGPWADRPPGD